MMPDEDEKTESQNAEGRETEELSEERRLFFELLAELRI